MGVRTNQSKTYRTPVSFFVLTEGGKPEEWSFVAEFKRLETEEVKAIIEQRDSDDKAKLAQVLVGWKMEDIETKEVTPFTTENFDIFCKQPKAAGNTMLRFLETVGGCREKP